MTLEVLIYYLNFIFEIFINGSLFFACESMTWLSWLIIFDYGISESW